MKKNERIQPNKVNAPTLFIGVGGVGSRIIKAIAKLTVIDDTSNIGFIVMDTDVNDLNKMNTGAKITAVQTSSTSTVGEYLECDDDARINWFPGNEMLNPKPVSEGAGQIRAISRLALDATVESGNIKKLYKEIDDLFLKDGGEYRQAIRVVIASAATGGTGSGMAMETAMMVREYVKKNYPSAAAMIRGFFMMPSVLDKVIDTQSERESQRCNGYATIKEINAFMMKGSGFFDTVPELRRYKDLHISVPGTFGKIEKLSCLPFDFCFLMDSTDSNTSTMKTKEEYEAFAARALYEQNIGPMRTKCSSMEDNILKLCIDPEKMGRCRFGGIGASALKYPYEDIRDYIALNWAREAIIGTSSNSELSDSQKKEMLNQSWMQYDAEFKEMKREYDENPNASAKEPKLEEEYVLSFKKGASASSGNNFTARLWANNVEPKIAEITNGDSEMAETEIDFIESEEKKFTKTQKVALNYISRIIHEILTHTMDSTIPGFKACLDLAEEMSAKTGHNHATRFMNIWDIESISQNEEAILTTSETLARAIFSSKSSVKKEGLGEYMLEKYLSVNGKSLHPNAARFMLYELYNVLLFAQKEFKSNSDWLEYEKTLKEIKGEGEGDKDRFQVKGLKSLEKESNLQDMCKACDANGLFGGTTEGDSCEQYLSAYFKTVKDYLLCKIGTGICNIAVDAVSGLLKSYEKFYNTFETKVTSIEAKKEDILTKVSESKGDYILYLFNNKKYLDALTKMTQRPSDSGAEAAELYANIFESVRNNYYIEKRESILNYEAKEDIFDDVIIEYYKDRVEESCEEINVKGILQAINLEFKVKNALELEEISELIRDERAAELSVKENLDKYINAKIAKCRNLASPGISKNDHGENREVNATVCSEDTEDGDGIRVLDYLPKAEKSNTVSAYELRFFRSIYNIMPTQIAKLAAPKACDKYAPIADDLDTFKTAGDYFKVYHEYMDKIGPDSRSSAVITPHVDRRWNAICELPELDLDFQKRLMKKIHKAFLYGLIYNRIRLCNVSEENENERAYRYLDDEENIHDLIVSNRTRCDVLYEVLDALYFDRKAVSIICNYVSDIQLRLRADGCKTYTESEFFKKLDSLSCKKFINCEENKLNEEKTSVFEIPLRYANVLPAQSKDESELRTMIEAIIEVVYSEIALCSSNADSIRSKTANVIIEHYNLLLDNYKNNKDLYRTGIFSDEVIQTIITGAIVSFLKNNDLLKYKEKMNEF